MRLLTDILILDSAPSPMTKRDYAKFFSVLRIPITVKCTTRQLTHSNECGLHTVCNILRALRFLLSTNNNHEALYKAISGTDTTILSLNSLRLPLLERASATPGDILFHGLLDSILDIDAVEGGADEQTTLIRFSAQADIAPVVSPEVGQLKQLEATQPRSDLRCRSALKHGTGRHHHPSSKERH